MVNDKWGLPFLYPSKPDGFFWQQKDDISQDSHWEAEGDMSNVGGGSFQMDFSGPTSGVLVIDPSFLSTNAIGGCKMNFSDTEARGFAYKDTDLQNLELKFIMDTDLDGGFSASQTSGKHSGSGCCSGFAYMINMECNTDPVQFRFRKEMWHVSYHTDPKTGDFTSDDFDFKLNGHGNVGISFVKYVKKDGISKGHDSVILEFWGNPDPDDDPQNWILIKKTEDKGGWGNDGDKCNGNKDQVGSWGMPKFRLKSNSTGSITFKHLSLREIDPLAEPDDNPDNPDTNPPVDQPSTTSTIIGSFKLYRDVNIERANPCSLTGDKPFFEWISDESEFNIADADVADNIKRVGEICKNSASSLYLKVPSKLDVKLMKVGSPTSSPGITANIRNSSGSLKYTSPTTIDPATLTGALATRTFDFSTNTYQMQVGDRIYVEYTGTSETDYVRIGVRDIGLTDEADGTDSELTYYDGDWTNSPSRDLACIIYEA